MNLIEFTNGLCSAGQECCSIPLWKIEDDPSSKLGWKLLFLLPRIILQPQARGGRIGMREINQNINELFNFIGNN